MPLPPSCGIDRLTHKFFEQSAINAGAIGWLRPGDIRLEEAVFIRIGDDLKITLPSNGSITITGWFAPSTAAGVVTVQEFTAPATRLIETVAFSDFSLTAVEVTARVGVYLTPGNANYTSTSGADVVYGLGGNDDIYGAQATTSCTGEPMMTCWTVEP